LRTDIPSWQRGILHWRAGIRGLNGGRMAGRNHQRELETFERALGRDLLRRVSRSLFLSLRWLPPAVRGPMSLAYLMARTSDTLADSGELPAGRRREALQHFRDDLAAYRSEAGWPDFLPPDEGERELLRRWPDVMGWFWAIARDERQAIRETLGHILDGQIADLERTSMPDDEALDHYTYQVAGSVGELWTRICAMRVPGFAPGSIDELLPDAVRLGKGLQLINVLRDVPKDAAMGRSYLPGAAAAAPAESKWRAAQPWIERCSAHLDAGERYAGRIRGWRCRFAVRLPMRLARETLALIREAGPRAMESPQKVPRGRLRWLMAAAAWRSI
jgi:farnesyl-diphosphate farnesyltransferase